MFLNQLSVLKIIFRLFWFLIKSMFYLLNQKQIFINEYIWSIKLMSSAANINKLWMKTSSNFISLNWKTAKSLMMFYLEKIYCESLKTCTRNYYKKYMINLQSFILIINESLIEFSVSTIDQIIELLFNDTFETVILINEAKSLEIASMNFIILSWFHRNAEKI